MGDRFPDGQQWRLSPDAGDACPLLPDGPVFGFTYTDGSVEMRELDGHRLVYEDGRTRELTPEPYRLSVDAPRIAVLIDERTVSAGEITAMAFKGLANARFFGTLTAGLTTGNASTTLLDGSRLALAIAVDLDRDGVVYEAGLEPDEVVEIDPDTYLRDEDPVIQAALAYVRGNEEPSAP